MELINKFIKKARDVHGDKYDYSKVEYVNNKTKVCIVCPEHGEFWQRPDKHISRKDGCPNCGGTKKLDRYEFIWKAIQKHGYKYDYRKVNYINFETKVCIIDKVYGEFWQTPHAHLMGNGCFLSSITKKLDKNEFIWKAIQKHGYKYDYRKVEYKTTEENICIICNKHGEFWQTPHNHLSGCGCPICKESKLEKEIRIFLTKEKILFESQKKFDWLKLNNPLSLDFYLPDYNIAIECQGIQHFKPVNHFGGKIAFINNRAKDISKYNLCKENGIKIIYYSNINLPFFKNIINNVNDLLKHIKE